MTIALALASLILPAPTPEHKAVLKHPNPLRRAVASYYDDSGPTASGRHYTYGFAALIFGNQWGKKILFCARRCAYGWLDDHGPYVGGRTFDLNIRLKYATGCSDLCHLKWRYTK